MKPRKKVEKDFYSEYPYNQPNFENYVTKAQYKEIILKFFDNLVDHLIQTGEIYRVPGRLGEFYIKKFRATKSKLNYQAWKEGKYQLYTNGHSLGYSVRLMWDKKGVKLKHSKMFKFTPVRRVSRRIAKETKTNNHIYKYIG